MRARSFDTHIHQGGFLALRRNLPSARAIATVAGVVVTAVLMLELGIWYFIALVAIYAVLDLIQRAEARRDAGLRVAILNSQGQPAACLRFIGPTRCCETAAWTARRLGWLVHPIVREGFGRHSILFRSMHGASSLTQLLEALHADKLASSILLPVSGPTYARRLADQINWDAVEHEFSGQAAVPLFFRKPDRANAPVEPSRQGFSERA